MKTPQGWTNYSGGTYFVRVPVAPASRQEERETGNVQDNSSPGAEPAGQGGNSDVAARAHW